MASEKITPITKTMESDRERAFNDIRTSLGFLSADPREVQNQQRAEALERLVTGSIGPRDVPTFAAILDDVETQTRQVNDDIKKHPDLEQAAPIPSSILAQMKLSEYFFQCEGDVAETILIPRDLGMTDLILKGGDKRVREDLEFLYRARHLDIETVLADLWMMLEIYGNAFPFELWDGTIPHQIVPLDPKQVMVGKSSVGTTQYFANPSISDGFQEALSDYQNIPMSWQSGGQGLSPNERMFPGGYFRIPGEMMIHIKSREVPSIYRYGHPPLSRVFRTLTTRQAIEEMIRAAVEGNRNQLWTFLLGDADHLPTDAEVIALKQELQRTSGERTGYLVWYGNLTVNTHTPNFDNMIGNEKWKELTLHMLRQRGFSMRVLSGEVANGTVDRSNMDIKILLKRIESMQRHLLRWLQSINEKYVERNIESPRVRNKILRNMPQLGFSPISLEVEDLIRNRLQPLMMAGKISIKTYLEEAGYNYDQELENKKKEQKDLEIWTPAPIYNQTVSKPGAANDKKETAVNPEGAPKEVTRDPLAVDPRNRQKTTTAKP